jgi:TolB protein
MLMGKASLGICLVLLLFAIIPAGAVSIENLKKLDIPQKTALDPNPILSPDGMRIAYVAYDSSFNQQIFIINIDGTGNKAITNDTLKKWGLAWGPDKIAYVSFAKDGLEKIYVINPDGTDNKQLILDNTRQGNAAEDKPPTWAAPSWNQDGKTLLYTSLDEMSNPKMYTVNADGTGKKLVFTDNFKQWSPSFSPDGKDIVYVSYTDKYEIELFKVDAAGTASERLTLDTIKKNNPVWGPDGTIAYVSYENISSSNEKIFAINQDGTNKRLFVDSDFKQRSPSFSRDGSKFAYAAIDAAGTVKIAVGDVAGRIAGTPTIAEGTIVATATETATPAMSVVQTPEVKETPAGNALKNVMTTMLVILAIIVIVMLVILAISNIFSKK